MLFPKPFILWKQKHVHFEEDHSEEDIQEIKETLRNELFKSQQENESEAATASPVKPIQMRPSHNDSNPQHKDAGLFYVKNYPALSTQTKHHDFSEIFIH